MMMKLFTSGAHALLVLQILVQVLVPTLVKGQCCNSGADPAGIPFASFSGRVCRNIGDNGFRWDQLVYRNNSLRWSNLYDCEGNANITHYADRTEFVLVPTAPALPDARCDGAVLTIYSAIRPNSGDFGRVNLVLGDGHNCGDGPLQLSCETRPCCANPDGCQDPNQAATGGGGGLCFSKDATVQVLQQDGRKEVNIAMKDLKLGDFVKTNKGYQPIYSFGHYDLETSTNFLRIHTNLSKDKKPLEITNDHLLFLHNQDTPVTAGSIKVGDKLHTIEGFPATVTKINTVYKQGLYAPLTASGTVVVDGILASSYITLQPKSGAFVHFQGIKTWISQQQYVHILLSPHRILCMGLFPILGATYTNNGMPIWIDYGIQYIKTAHATGQSIFIEVLLLLICLSFTIFFYLLELLVGPNHVPLVLATMIYFYYSYYKANIHGKTNKPKKV